MPCPPRWCCSLQIPVSPSASELWGAALPKSPAPDPGSPGAVSGGGFSIPNPGGSLLAWLGGPKCCGIRWLWLQIPPEPWDLGLEQVGNSFGFSPPPPSLCLSLILSPGSAEPWLSPSQRVSFPWEPFPKLLEGLEDPEVEAVLHVQVKKGFSSPLQPLPQGREGSEHPLSPCTAPRLPLLDRKSVV